DRFGSSGADRAFRSAQGDGVGARGEGQARQMAYLHASLPARGGPEAASPRRGAPGDREAPALRQRRLPPRPAPRADTPGVVAEAIAADGSRSGGRVLEGAPGGGEEAPPGKP